MKPIGPVKGRGTKVARVITRLNVGGPSHHVTILASGLRPRYETALLAGRSEPREGSLNENAVAAGARLVLVPGLRRPPAPLQDLRALLWLYRFFRRERPQIVATHMAKAGTLGRLAAALAGVPIRVHTFHGHVLDGYFGRATTVLYRTVERWLGLLTTHFVAISPEIAGDIEGMGIGLGKVTVIPLGLQLEALREARPGPLHGELGLSPEVPLVGIVGRLVPIKAHDLFLDAAVLLRREQPLAQFVIVGDGELWDRLHAAAVVRGLAGVVHFTGWREDLDRIYGDLAVVVCCSLNEGTPVSIIEAGAAGRPVVGTRVGGMAHIIEDGVNGTLVPSGDAQALARALAAIISDPELGLRMGSAGRRLAFAKHSKERMVSEIEALYDRLLEEHAPASGRS